MKNKFLFLTAISLVLFGSQTALAGGASTHITENQSTTYTISTPDPIFLDSGVSIAVTGSGVPAVVFAINNGLENSGTISSTNGLAINGSTFIVGIYNRSGGSIVGNINIGTNLSSVLHFMVQAIV